MITTLIKNSPLNFSIDRLLEKRVVPDFIIRIGIRNLLKDRLNELQEGGNEAKVAFLETLKGSRLAIMEKEANEQHYEVPTEYFKLCLGPRLKYSCALFEDGINNLKDAEDKMFELVAKRAELVDGQDILELGCGWGSLTIYLARKFPNSNITAISNSRTQKIHIDAYCEENGINNVEIITANVVEFDTDKKYDRVCSIEMFEHMRNYESLLRNISKWLKDDGKLFVHIFCHDFYSYPFDVVDDSDWMSKYFFSGGIMPSFDIFEHFNKDLKIEKSYKVNGHHYSKTCEEWLKNMDANESRVREIFRDAYGEDQKEKWIEYWRIFYMACSELFKMDGGEQWYVGHYLLKK